ncbi:hypothetical protein CPB83DRAFT_898107 [Crepidotus variabilis]|uniref:Uncharacterized protein n=1 Tax=Crepidotus variabilis TaxID=179855 RepID=A0A9P6JKE6_9AGAR|nr:hypothetical protein CPB83DRAFT_898107 [Crepidotus variabilis]
MHNVDCLLINYPILPQPSFSLTVLYDRSEIPDIFDLGHTSQSRALILAPFSSSPEEATRVPPVLIPKPQGQAGALSRGGYSLRKVLKWDSKQYADVQNYARERIKHHVQKGQLFPGQSIMKQPAEIILNIQAEASQINQYLT